MKEKNFLIRNEKIIKEIAKVEVLNSKMRLYDEVIKNNNNVFDAEWALVKILGISKGDVENIKKKDIAKQRLDNLDGL